MKSKRSGPPSAGWGLLAPVLLLVLAGGPSCGRPAPRPGTASAGADPRDASLLLVTIDTWRWDYIGASGAGRVETPHLDRLAREGIYEKEAVTPCPLTTPAHATILTGLDPSRHRIWDCTLYTLAESIPTLAEDFRAAGFATAAFLSSETLHRRFGLHRGFEVYDEVAHRDRGGGEWWAASRDGSEATAAALAFHRTRPAGSRLFLWVHYYDAHLPYRPRPGIDERYPKDPYAAQVAFIDGEVGTLLASLRGDGRKWRVVVAGDHGEGLGDRGEITHGIGLYRSTLHVPLILHPRPERPPALSKPWGLVDLRPTLLAWYGLPAGPGGDGESLFSGGGEGRVLHAVTLLPTLFFGAQPTLGVRRGPHFYLRHGSEELYDLEADPGQTLDLSAKAAAADALGVLRGLCDRQWPRGWYASALPTARPPSSEEDRKLRSLGYLAGGAPAAVRVRSAPLGQMMRDHGEWELAHEAAQASGGSGALLDLLPRLVGRYPDSFALRKDWGNHLGKTGRTGEAIPQLEAAARLYAADATVWGNLGAMYLGEGRIGDAQAALERSVALDPDRAGTRKNLGIIYLDHLGRTDIAVLHFKKYLEAGGDADAERIRAFIRDAERANAAGGR